MLHDPLPDFYSLLQIPRDASPSDVKIAYHRTLLRLHPDKHVRSRPHLGIDTAQDTMTLAVTPGLGGSTDMALVKEAYRTLSDVETRAAYDGSLKQEEHARSHGPRPAQVVSLEEFEAEPGNGTERDVTQEWRFGCRCGGVYRIGRGDLENGTHLVGCGGCSEVIWVGYEEVEDGE